MTSLATQFKSIGQLSVKLGGVGGTERDCRLQALGVGRSRLYIMFYCRIRHLYSDVYRTRAAWPTLYTRQA